jgi:acyl carrier protein
VARVAYNGEFNVDDIQWSDNFETVLRSYLPGLADEQDLTQDLDLAEHGLDSLGTVNLLLDLEEAFGMTFPDDRLTPGTFATPASMWKVLRELAGA